VNQVFISYKREDELRVGRIARALEAAGLDVWWDRGLPAGESWHANIESKLQHAGCVVVVWSYASASPDGGYVREEARRGLGRNILVPVMIDRLSDLPLGFGEVQAIDLAHWRGDQRDPFFEDLVATIRAKLEGVAPVAPRGPTRRIARRLMWGSFSGAGLTAAAVFAFNGFGVASQVCTLPGPQPGLSDSCGLFGLGGRPSQSERLAWASRPQGSCAALREHIARFPEGAYRREAADLLTARRVTTVDTWRPATKSLVLFAAGVQAPARDEQAAKAATLERARPDSDRLCRAFGAGSLYQYVSATAVAEQWSCNRQGPGMVCSFDGHAECTLREKQQIEQESCGSPAAAETPR
jgi:hypothetical protein